MFRIFFSRKRNKGIEIDDSIITAAVKEEAIIESPFERKGLFSFWLIVAVAILGLAARVFYLDFFRGDYYNEVSKNNRIRSIVIKAPRGMIFDRHGKVLAGNIPGLDAIVVPLDLPENTETKKKVAENLAGIIEMDYKDIEETLNSQDLKSLSPILLKENISQDQALVIMERIQDLPGISVEKSAIRHYENGAIFSHTIGYNGKITKEEIEENQDYLMTDYIGKIGLEKEYEKELKGKPGATQVEVDSFGNIRKTIGLINPIAGNDLVLNIDDELQKKIYDSLSAILEKTNAKNAAAVAIDPRNGGVLAMVSLPSFDNNLFARGISNEDYNLLVNDKYLPLFNQCLAGVYPPGSTLKPAVAVAALSEGIINSKTTVECSGAIFINTWRFGDWKAHGTTDVRKAIAESCDVFFYSIGGGYGSIQGLGMDKMKKYEKMFGFGEKTGIDLPGESPGFIPDEEWKLNKIKEKWYIGDSYHAAIGQGFITATPLQLANYTAAIANGGTLYVPRVVNRIKKNDKSEEIINPEIINYNFVDKGIINIVKEGMRQAVTSGTAQVLNSLPVAVAGKTGTAQFGTENKTHSWFISFAPYDNPVIAMAVIIPGGGEGNSAALPATKEVYEWYFSR